jgi:hypothetical protein
MARQSWCLALSACCWPAALDGGFGEGDAALTTPALSTAVAATAPMVLTASSANRCMSSHLTEEIGELDDEAALSEGRCGRVRFL